MKHVGSVANEVAAFAKQQMAERDQEVRGRVNGRDVFTFVGEEHGDDIANLFPDDFTLDDYITTTNDALIDEAKRRLKLCATCPPHGGACGSDYEQNQGKAPRWDRDKGLRLDWCPRWSEHILRKKLMSVGIGEQLLAARFATYVPSNNRQRSAKKKCESYAQRFDRRTTGGNLLIAGANYGIGKTHLAVSVVADLLARYRLRTAKFVFVPEFLEQLRRAYEEPEKRNLIDNAMNADLLVLDDLGAHRTTEWVQEQMNLISNARWAHRRPTIITTNASPEETAATLGPRATSRFLGNVDKQTDAVYLDGDDKRWLK